MTTCLLQKDKKCELEESTTKKEIKGEKGRKRKIMGHSIIDLLKVKGMTIVLFPRLYGRKLSVNRWKILEKRTSLCLV